MITSPGENGNSYLLTVRSERPIQGCEINPNPFLQIKGGAIDNASRARLLDPNNVYYSFSWSRGQRGSGCLNENCPRGGSFDPTRWSKAAVGGPGLICNVCLSTGYSAHEAAFCSKACFVSAWKVHSQRHSLIRKITSLSDGSDSVNEEEDALPSSESTKTTVSSGGETWVPLSTDRMYTPKLEDIGCRLRLQVRAFSTIENMLLAGPVSVITDPVLSAPIRPPKRSLHAIPGASGAGMAGAVRFRVVSYNILAEIYATKQAYPYVDTWNLSWPYRRKLLFDELEEMQGDIVCLQEVQADHYENDINPFMNSLGYDGIYKPKSREFMGQYGKVDGCATFWKKSKFIMTENYGLEFNDMARQASSNFEESEARKYMNRLNRDNIAQIVVLESLTRSNNNRNNGGNNNNNNNGNNGGRNALCIVNTHLYSNHQRPDVKLWQSIQLIREIQQFVASREMALLICGDFNSEPHSAVYEYIAQGAITHDHPEFSMEEKVRILPNVHEIVHNLDLASAMQTALSMEPEYTNYTAKFKGTLDYIFYTPGRLRILAVTGIPEANEIQSYAGEGLPCACYPSDHVLLCCDVAMILSGNGSIFNNSAGTVAEQQHVAAAHAAAAHHAAAMAAMSVNIVSSPPLTGMPGPSSKSTKSNRSGK